MQTWGAFARGASSARALLPGSGVSDLGPAVCSRGGAADSQVQGENGALSPLLGRLDRVVNFVSFSLPDDMWIKSPGS